MKWVRQRLQQLLQISMILSFYQPDNLNLNGLISIYDNVQYPN